MRIFGNLLVLLTLLPVTTMSLSEQAVSTCPVARPLSEREVTELIKLNMSHSGLIERITACSVSFPSNAEAETRLKQAGATEEILAAVRKAAPANPMPTFRPQIQQALRDRNWNTAENKIAELLKVIPENDEIRGWRKTISDSRAAERAELDLWSRIKDGNQIEPFQNYLRVFPKGLFAGAANGRVRELTLSTRLQIQQALRDGRWDAAETRIAELLKVTSEDEEVRSWRRSISEGRDADRAAIARAETEKRRAERDAEMKMLKFEFVSITPGEFLMGCSQGDNECDKDEQPAHRVRIEKTFEIGKYEVTQAMWESVMGNNPSNFNGADRPVERVTWNEIQEFLSRLNQATDGHRYRLPTEAEWEYAARADTGGAYPVAPERSAWHDQNSRRETHSVGQLAPNAWGLYDMLGNVWEWVEDWYGESYYASSPNVDPRGPSIDLFRGLRGGSWLNLSTNVRVSSRVGDDPDSPSSSVGFRCVREVVP